MGLHNRRLTLLASALNAGSRILLTLIDVILGIFQLQSAAECCNRAPELPESTLR